MSKGSQFERDIARQLSLWWTGGERDDVFWRSSMSGGRATVRARSGKRTANQYGDISATDAVGTPLTENVLIELKRGYKNWSVMDILDSRTPHTSVFAKFLQQVRAACEIAGTEHFMLICRRDRRKAVVILSRKLGVLVGDNWERTGTTCCITDAGYDGAEYMVIGLNRFFDACPPRLFLDLFAREGKL